MREQTIHFMYLVRCVELIEMLKTNSKNIDLHSRTHIFIKKKGPKNKKSVGAAGKSGA